MMALCKRWHRARRQTDNRRPTKQRRGDATRCKRSRLQLSHRHRVREYITLKSRKAINLISVDSLWRDFDNADIRDSFCEAVSRFAGKTQKRERTVEWGCLFQSDNRRKLHGRFGCFDNCGCEARAQRPVRKWYIRPETRRHAHPMARHERQRNGRSRWNPPSWSNHSGFFWVTMRHLCFINSPLAVRCHLQQATDDG